MNERYVIGIDGESRRYEVLIGNDWVPIDNALPIAGDAAEQMRGYRVFKRVRSIAGEYDLLIKTFIDP